MTKSLIQLLQKAIYWSGLTSAEDIKLFKKSLSNQLKFWLLAVSIGFIAGFAAVADGVGGVVDVGVGVVVVAVAVVVCCVVLLLLLVLRC